MSVIVKCGTEICRANTNTSTAKFQYTFSKAARFPEPKQNKEKVGEYTFYNLPSTLSKRFTKFGYGTKSDFTRGDKNYAPKFYNPGSDFDLKKPHSPLYSFPWGRDKYGKVFLETAKPFDKNVPGPGKYNVLKQFGSEAPKVSFKGKYDNVETRKKKMEEEENSGKKPDKFSTITIQIRPSGKYAVSQIPNVNSLKFDKDKSKRTKFVSNKNPGPADYKFSSLFGRVFPSQFRSHEPITMAQRLKTKDSRTNYPGPGSYPIPSDFGQYQSKDADKYPKENVYPEEKPKDQDPRPWRHGMKKIKPKPKVEETYGDDNADTGNHDDNDYNHEYEDHQETERKNEEQTPEIQLNKEEEKKEEEKKEEEKNEENKKEEENKEEDKKDEEKKEEDLILIYDKLIYEEFRKK